MHQIRHGQTDMVQCKKSLPCAVHYAIIFASTVRDPPPSHRGHIPPFSSYGGILARSPKAALFLANGAKNGSRLPIYRAAASFDRLRINVLLFKTLQNLTGRVIFP
jgi:hypothetical protein